MPNQCLNLPPSLKLGEVYKRSSETWEYAQPNIDYFLKIEANFRPNGISTSLQSLETSKPVTIFPYSLPLPPTLVSDFPADFVTSASNTYRTLLLRSWYTMTLSMEEPPAVRLSNDHEPSSANAVLHIDIKTADGKANGTSARGMPLLLRELSFKVQPILRAKTFYSTAPFSKMPGQTMLTRTGPIRLKDEFMKLKEQEQQVASWQLDLPDLACASLGGQAGHRFLRAVTSSDSKNDGNVSSSGRQEFPSAAGESPGIWSSSILVPYEIPANLPPTFCSVTASRQHSLIFRIKVSAASVKDFLLGVPAQVIYAPRPEGAAERELSFSAREAPPTYPTCLLDDIFKDADVSSISTILAKSCTLLSYWRVQAELWRETPKLFIIQPACNVYLLMSVGLVRPWSSSDTTGLRMRKLHSESVISAWKYEA